MGAMQELLGPNGPKKEAQSRPLASLPTPDLRTQAWTQAQADSGKDQPSSREVDEAIAQVLEEFAALVRESVPLSRCPPVDNFLF